MTILNKALAMGLTVATMGSTYLVSSEAAYAQQRQQGVNGYNVSEVRFNGGLFRETGRGHWTEYGADGRVKFIFRETSRDDWSVYLDDSSRNIQLQIDIHRKWIRLGDNGGPMHDFYAITKASRNEGRTRTPPQPSPRAERARTNGSNVQQVYFAGGSFKKSGPGRWTEYNAQGRAIYNFTETGRDQWSVYLDDRSRNVQLQLDLYRNWIGYGQNGGAKSDLYQIQSSSRVQAAAPQRRSPPPARRPDPRPVSNTRNIDAGPIWNQQDAQRKCPAVAASQGGQWTGQWRTTVQGQMSVCEIRF
ncbi:mannan-binding lectin [uncultured Parasphingorhabdus sp.]|uniref:mannan-binding lectin n=1 Tax=uncultured Parasphingorhabdus sp. TaxID=2709694 RepID=UPI0030D8FD51|tara:strand:+ start:173941 stop:174849 length:909 start_codon:yes stop_codon:yes gene_type:complete